MLTKKVDELIQELLGTFFFKFPLINKIKYFWYMKRFGIKDAVYIGGGIRILALEPEIVDSEKVIIKKRISIEDRVLIDTTGGVEIGENVVISNDVRIYTHNHIIKDKRLRDSLVTKQTLKIGKEVWIASNSIVLPTVREIGDGAVIGAGAVVTKSVPKCTIVAGNPAKVIGHRDIDI